MTAAPEFSTLLDEIRKLYDNTPALQDFAPWPDDLRPQPLTPHYIPAADLMVNDSGLYSEGFAALRDAFIAASNVAQWRETYKYSGISNDFLDRFGCYSVIGGGGAYAADQLSAYVVYMPAGLHYPWHHHPAEEIYFILAGEAEFHLEGEPSKTLRPGDAVYHPSNRPHATDTHDHPFMALVLWRGDLNTRPVLSEGVMQ